MFLVLDVKLQNTLRHIELSVPKAACSNMMLFVLFLDHQPLIDKYVCIVQGGDGHSFIVLLPNAAT